ncbi:putative tyrosinase [Flammula alnicola]|nr:putative tyrosinase [Flammula alnicola]
MSSVRVRHSLQHIQQLYDSGEDRSKLENLIRAFRGIQALPPDDSKSFFHLAGLHGLPYRGPGETDPAWWGGYCWHGSVLFPTWHRIYMLHLEDALRSIPRCQDVTLPFWDELANLESTGEPLIPSVLTSPTFELDGRTDNPLYSYKLQKGLVEKVEDNRYSKHAGYDTVRYPLSGLVGTEADRQETQAHNAAFPDQAQNTKTLNNNVTEWLLGTVKIPNDPKDTRRPDTYSVRARFLRCLLAPNYTVFSNTASQNQWIKDHGQDPSTSHYVVSLESPHNAIHLAVGGFYQEGVYNAAPIRGANGDMGDNETAGFDPIFFFHHCFIDYTFSVWQRLWNCTKRGDLTLIRDYPGTILTEGQPPNFPRGTHINMTTPLYPFKKPSGEDYTSDNATDLNELGIAYGLGSLDPLIPWALSRRGSNPNVVNPFSRTKWVHNISRTQYEGSFVIRLYARGHDGKEVEVGREPILSRWNVKGCRNCQSHLDVDLYVPIDAATLELFEGPAGPTGRKAEIDWLVKIHARDGLHEFPTAAPGEDRGGEPVERPKVDDL